MNDKLNCKAMRALFVLFICLAANAAGARESESCLNAVLYFDEISPVLFRADAVEFYGGSDKPTCAQADAYEKWFLKKEEAAKNVFKLCRSAVITDYDYMGDKQELKNANAVGKFYSSWYTIFLNDKKRVCSGNQETLYSERVHKCYRLRTYYDGDIQKPPLANVELSVLVKACNAISKNGCLMVRSGVHSHGPVPAGLTCRATPAELAFPPK